MDQIKIHMGATSARGSARKYKTNPALSPRVSERIYKTNLAARYQRGGPKLQNEPKSGTDPAKWVRFHAVICIIHNQLYPDWVGLVETSWAGASPVRS
jgi:hypothetical protein